MCDFQYLNRDNFWALIEGASNQESSQASRLYWLQEQLSRRTVDEIIDFHALLIDMRNQAHTWDLYGVFCNVFDIGSLDSFEYFKLWLIGLGRSVYEGAVLNPDGLIEQRQMRLALEAEDSSVASRDELPQFERLAYVAFKPYVDISGKSVESLYAEAEARNGSSIISTLIGEEWDIDDCVQVQTRLPRSYSFMERYRSGLR
ncbi:MULTISPECIES: DUF4240 domain-containing protein [unclassified Nonomuraea]|uniref:DUF4240 domain-containing protein n=1 Tax=unclassified Nonomuraea TaxID=2593643 RepID=UPI001376C673|nr:MULTISPECIES: DUF4240 domain-containing protein [unclassified Nonomuraea]NBE95213.1 DUF4240 domain-containing protein [Nonomuraea sp. K271]